ncbi:uncharacterized protein LOC112513048 [Cynara cardunculus var. scolymus]|uniref:uncharacterized protein LOC112513048 n=1 Tax=Cynara cardunculus var. scolymus TaxID=59895 RepID=UPI000D62CE13|nr:uncharacterized protein LOC112513048 [Cynara cardunculus var. scolymus]
MPKEILRSSLWGSRKVDMAAVDPCGRSGGFLSFWDNYLFDKIDSFSGRNYLIVAGRWRPNGVTLGICNIYAPQDSSEKAALWSKLSDLLESIVVDVWLCCGDFNAVRRPNERLGSDFDSGSALDLNNFIFSNGLLDLNMGGRKFTRKSADGSKWSKWDRFLVSHNFLDIWPKASVVALPFLYSDHCPVLLDGCREDFGPIPFKLYNSWLHDADFVQLVKDGWIKNTNVDANSNNIKLFMSKLKHLKSGIKAWRKAKMESGKAEKIALRSKIDDFDARAMNRVLTDADVQARADAMKRVLEIDEAELCDLKQKAKARWDLEGDENTRFFHGILRSKYSRSNILGINENGSWIRDPIRIKNSAYEFFKRKFSEDVACTEIQK